MKLIKNFLDILYNLSFLKMAILLFILHIPYLIAYYPGLTIYDTASSIAQFFGLKTHVTEISNTPDAIMSNHHMIILTFIFGSFVKIGDIIGNQNIGFFMYVIFQVSFASLVVSYSIITIKQYIDKIGYYILILIYAFSPLVALWEITMSKDSIFSILFLLFIVILFKLAITKGKVLENRCFNTIVILTCLGLTLTKQQGIYIVLITTVVILLLERKKIWKIIYSFLLPSLLYQILIVALLLPAVGVAASGKQEMMGFMFQQTALTVKEHGDTITNEEKDVINKVLPYNKLPALYNPTNQDDVKFEYNQNASDNDRVEYISTWLKMFFKYPESYFKATFSNCAGFFILDTSDCNNSFMPLIFDFSPLLTKYNNMFYISNVKVPLLYPLIQVTIDKLSSIPVINIIFKESFYVYWALISCIILLIRKRKESFYYIVPILLSVLLCFISPVVDFRYILPLVFALPFLSLCIIHSHQKENHKK